MAKAATALKKSTKFKAGDYIVAPDKVFLRIIAVIDSGMGAMYFLVNPRPSSTRYAWESQYELDEDGMEVGEPNFELARKIKPGDILNLGSPESANYATVLARIDNAVLLSNTPDKKKADMLLKMDQKMREMGEELGASLGGLLDDGDRAKINKMRSSVHASKTTGEWWDVDTIALMNWQILGDE